MNLDPGLATIIAAAVAALGAVIVAMIHGVKSSVKKTSVSIEQVAESNRSDHAYVINKLTEISEAVHEVKLDTRDMKYDIADLKDMQREHTRRLKNHGGRIDLLEDVLDGEED